MLHVIITASYVLRRINGLRFQSYHHTAHLRQECHNSKFGIFELLV
jgi:hypothetical protein